MLEKVSRENKLIYLLGDYNIDLTQSVNCDFTGSSANSNTRQNINYNSDNEERNSKIMKMLIALVKNFLIYYIVMHFFLVLTNQHE